ncbi:PilZ domain-containing protein [Maridesulfovibrio hydrothermalis]|nr:PilZ domain-containing protein [Maridesulfovibrio hydrothermalis]
MAYIKALRSFDIQFDVAESLSDISKNYNKVKYNGFIIDVPTLLRAGAADKAEANLLIDNFPVLRLNYKASDGIRCLPTGKYSGHGNTLEEFLWENCSKFAPRSLRGTKKGTRVLNVLLNRDLNSPARGGEKSVTINFSSEGAFFFSVAGWKKGDSLWVLIKELSDKTPIKAEVMRVIPWGKTQAIPGISVNFLNLSEGQADQIEELIQEEKV